MNDKDNRLISEMYSQITEISITGSVPAPEDPGNEYNVRRDKKDTWDERDPVPGAGEMIELWDDGEGEEQNIGYMIRNDIDNMYPSGETRELIQREVALFRDNYGSEAAKALRDLIRTYFAEQHEQWTNAPHEDREHDANVYLRAYGLPELGEDDADWWKE
jgi:hypothetical protein